MLNPLARSCSSGRTAICLLAGLIAAACGGIEPPASAPAVPTSRLLRAQEEQGAPAPGPVELVRPHDDAPPELAVAAVLEESIAPEPEPSPAAAPPAGVNSASVANPRQGRGGPQRPNPGDSGLNGVPSPKGHAAPQHDPNRKLGETPQLPDRDGPADPVRRRDRKP